MANRQDSGSNSAHQNQRPTPGNENSIPEGTEVPPGDAGESEDDEEEDQDDEDDEDDGRRQ